MKLMLCACLLFAAAPAHAMSFSLNGDTIYATGDIEEGDAARFAAFVSQLPHGDVDSPPLIVSLSSPGGNLFEGMRLGEAIRAAGIPTLVKNGNTCASACAIAFLGGTIVGATKDGVWRELEPGAVLGFHGFYSDEQQVRLANETLGEARIVNALIFEYATHMGSVHVGLLSELLTIPPDQIEVIDTPREIEGLGIGLVGNPPKPPRGWAMTACRGAVADILGPLDPIGVSGRLVGDPEPMPYLGAFRSRLLDDKYPRNDSRYTSIREAVSKLPASDAIDLLAGEAIYADSPKVGAWRVRLERGAGFYYDACYAVTDFTSIRTIIVDGVGPAALTRGGSTLLGFPPDQRLW